MKNFLAIAFFTIGISFCSSAQSKEYAYATIEEKAKLDAASLIEVVQHNSPDYYESIYQLFLKKHSLLNKKEITLNEKKEVNKIIEGKLRATFTEEEIKKIQEKGIWNKLLQ